MQKMSGQQEKLVNKIVSLYRKLACVPVPKSAQIENTSTTAQTSIRTRWTQRDLERTENVTFLKNYLVTKDNGGKQNVIHRSMSKEISNELWNKESPSGKLRAIASKFTPKKGGDDKYFIEIWNDNFKQLNVDILSQEKHGKLYEPDVTFACFEWSPSEKYLLYLAEKKEPKAVSYFDTKKSDSKDDSQTTVKGTEHDFKLDWGEQNTGKCKSVLCILEVETGDIKVLDTVPDDVFPGQAVWGPSDNEVVFTGWNIEPFKLGVIYCPTRDSSIYFLNLESGSLKKLSEDGRSARSPSFNLDYSKLVYLDNNVGGPHLQCSRLMMSYTGVGNVCTGRFDVDEMDVLITPVNHSTNQQYTWNNQTLSTVIDIVRNPTGESFPGVFALSFPERCWAVDNKRIVMNTMWRSSLAVIVVNTETKSVTKMTSDHNGNYMLLDVYKDKLVIQCSSPTIQPYLCIGELPGDGSEAKINLDNLDGAPVIDDSYTWEIIKHVPTSDRSHHKYGIQEYESILLCPKVVPSGTKPPLVLFPHGGPHAAFTTDYTIYTAGMSLCGFAVLMVNYRGSAGFGEDFIYSLPGFVGDLDVKDVKTAADDVIKANRVDSNKIAVFGGSHGGFLTTHLIGQYPDLYKAACCRNPVTNIPAMFGVSDIPDWCYCETGHDFNHKSLADDNVLRDAWKKSPLQYVDQVKTPVIVMLGCDDRRVPPKQGEEYYKALKARGAKCRLIAYEGNCHPIIKVDSEADAFVNIMDWYTQHLDITDI